MTNMRCMWETMNVFIAVFFAFLSHLACYFSFVEAHSEVVYTNPILGSNSYRLGHISGLPTWASRVRNRISSVNFEASPDAENSSAIYHRLSSPWTPANRSAPLCVCKSRKVPRWKGLNLNARGRENGATPCSSKLFAHGTCSERGLCRRNSRGSSVCGVIDDEAKLKMLVTAADKVFGCGGEKAQGGLTDPSSVSINGAGKNPTLTRTLKEQLYSFKKTEIGTNDDRILFDDNANISGGEKSRDCVNSCFEGGSQKVVCSDQKFEDTCEKVVRATLIIARVYHCKTCREYHVFPATGFFILPSGLAVTSFHVVDAPGVCADGDQLKPHLPLGNDCIDGDIITSSPTPYASLSTSSRLSPRAQSGKHPNETAYSTLLNNALYRKLTSPPHGRREFSILKDSPCCNGPIGGEFRKDETMFMYPSEKKHKRVGLNYASKTAKNSCAGPPSEDSCEPSSPEKDGILVMDSQGTVYPVKKVVAGRNDLDLALLQIDLSNPIIHDNSSQYSDSLQGKASCLEACQEPCGESCYQVKHLRNRFPEKVPYLKIHLCAEYCDSIQAFNTELIKQGAPIGVVSHPDSQLFMVTDGIICRHFLRDCFEEQAPTSLTSPISTRERLSPPIHSPNSSTCSESLQSRERNVTEQRIATAFSAPIARGSSGAPVFDKRTAKVIAIADSTRSIHYDVHPQTLAPTNPQMVLRTAVPSLYLRLLVKRPTDRRNECGSVPKGGLVPVNEKLAQ